MSSAVLKLFRCRISDDICLLLCFSNKLTTRNKFICKVARLLMSNSIDPDETAYYEPLISVYAVCKSLLSSPMAVKELKVNP